MGVVEVNLFAILTSALQISRQVHVPATLLYEKISRSSFCKGPDVTLGRTKAVLAKRKTPAPVMQLVASHFTECAIIN
jgi:hypothetical protein